MFLPFSFWLASAHLIQYANRIPIPPKRSATKNETGGQGTIRTGQGTVLCVDLNRSSNITECILGKGIALGGDIDDCLVYFKNHDVGRRDT